MSMNILYIRQLVTVLAFLLLATTATAQTVRSWEDYLNRMGEQEDMESSMWEQTYDELSELHEHKLDLNACTREDLQRLPFLSEQQIMDIMEYRDRYGRLESGMELRMIRSLEREDCDMLLQFFDVGERQQRDTLPSLRHLLRYAQHEWVGYVRVPFYERAGDDDGYLGDRYKHWMRYTLTSSGHLKIGLLGSKDAGEPFFKGKNSSGYDFYSAYLMLKNIGRLKKLVVGRYRMRSGMGLVLNNSYSFGKLNTLSTLGRGTTHITPHGSRSEATYLQGAAATVALTSHLDITAFASWRKCDATLNDDSLSVATLLTSGYHRTESEMARRRNTEQTAAGGNLHFFKHGFHFGLTGLYTAYNRDLKPNTSQEYRQWYPDGRHFWNASVDYGYISGRFSFSGETATGTRGHVATINSVSYRLGSSWQIMALQRYYPYQFVSIMGESFAEGGSVNNESGVYLGAQWQPLRGMKVLAYSDVAYFAWPKYQASAASHSFDNLLQVERQLNHWSWLLRYRLKLREYDNSEKTALEYRAQHRGRASLGYQSGRWSLRTQGDLSYYRDDEGALGYMLTEHAAYAAPRWTLRASVGYFNTDDYSSRVYAYEPGTLYAYAFQSFYGEGLRATLQARWQATRWLLLIAKLGATHYMDRSQIGSALQLIDGRNQTDLELQAKVKL